MADRRGAGEMVTRQVVISVCEDCLNSVGSECHTPGCWFWMNDVPSEATARILREYIIEEVADA